MDEQIRSAVRLLIRTDLNGLSVDDLKILKEKCQHRLELEIEYSQVKELNDELMEFHHFGTADKDLYLSCSASCFYWQVCANHDTAGDYRSEGGFTPRIYIRDNEVYCSGERKSAYCIGAVRYIAKTRKLSRYNSYREDDLYPIIEV